MTTQNDPDPSAPTLSGGVPGSAAPASLARRAAARLIDGVLLAVATSVVGMVLGLNRSSPFGLSSYVDTAVSSLLNAAIFLAYWAYLETSTGQTLGKKCLGITVTAGDGEPIGLAQAVTRNVWVVCGAAAVVPVIGSPLGGLASLVAVVTIAIGIHADKLDRRGWHDQLAGGTRVVTLP